MELEISDIAFGGKGISKIQTEQGTFIVFVWNTIPGQVVKARRLPAIVRPVRRRFPETRRTAQ